MKKAILFCFFTCIFYSADVFAEDNNTLIQIIGTSESVTVNYYENNILRASYCRYTDGTNIDRLMIFGVNSYLILRINGEGEVVRVINSNSSFEISNREGNSILNMWRAKVNFEYYIIWIESGSDFLP